MGTPAVGPALFVSKPVQVQAMQWWPGDLALAGAMVGWLLVEHRLPITHPSGTGDTTTLLLGEDYDLLEPGGWVFIRDGVFFTLDDESFRSMYEEAV